MNSNLKGNTKLFIASPTETSLFRFLLTIKLLESSNSLFRNNNTFSTSRESNRVLMNSGFAYGN